MRTESRSSAPISFLTARRYGPARSRRVEGREEIVAAASSPDTIA
jgi:hypothetical protein